MALVGRTEAVETVGKAERVGETAEETVGSIDEAYTGEYMVDASYSQKVVG